LAMENHLVLFSLDGHFSTIADHTPLQLLGTIP
jgi:hypothetical protein